MAGRLLPIALATVSGIAIGVATFGEEFKAQRKKRLEEDYEREVTAVSSLNSDGPSPMASSAVKPPTHEQLPTKTNEDGKPSKLASKLGFWAWQRPQDTTSSTNDQGAATNITAASKPGRDKP